MRGTVLSMVSLESLSTGKHRTILEIAASIDGVRSLFSFFARIIHSNTNRAISDVSSNKLNEGSIAPKYWQTLKCISTEHCSSRSVLMQ